MTKLKDERGKALVNNRNQKNNIQDHQIKNHIRPGLRLNVRDSENTGIIQYCYKQMCNRSEIQKLIELVHIVITKMHEPNVLTYNILIKMICQRKLKLKRY